MLDFEISSGFVKAFGRTYKVSDRPEFDPIFQWIGQTNGNTESRVRIIINKYDFEPERNYYYFGGKIFDYKGVDNNGDDIWVKREKKFKYVSSDKVFVLLETGEQVERSEAFDENNVLKEGYASKADVLVTKLRPAAEEFFTRLFSKPEVLAQINVSS